MDRPDEYIEWTDDPETEDEDWQRLTEAQFHTGYAESDSIYDDLLEDDSDGKSQ